MDTSEKMQAKQDKADLKNEYIKARLKAFSDYPDLLRTSIPEYTSGMDLQAAFKKLSFLTNGQGNSNSGVSRTSSLERIAPNEKESIMPGRPVVSNAQQREKTRAIGRKVSNEPIKGTVISGDNADFDSPEYAAAAQPGGLFEQQQDDERSAIQKAVFGSPQVGTPGSSDYKPASLDYQESTENSEDENGKPKKGKSAKGTAQVGTAPSEDFQAGVAAMGYYDTPYGRISAKKGRVGDELTPIDVHRTSLAEGLEGMGRNYDPNARYGSRENPIYRGAFPKSQKSEYNKNPDTTDPAERKRLGYTENNDGDNYSYYGPAGDGPQNEVTNPTMDEYYRLNLKLKKTNPSLFTSDTPQNKRFVEDFRSAYPDYEKLDPIAKLKIRNSHMKSLSDDDLKDEKKYGEQQVALSGVPGAPSDKDPNRLK